MVRIANPNYCQNISLTPFWLPAKKQTDKRESEADMFLNYFALGVLIFVFLVIFYGIIAIHDIPYLIAKKRNHPHADAIHTAGWVSLFTLHVIWPFLWIWATLYQPERGWGMQSHVASQEKATDPEIAALSDRISRLEHQLAAEKKTDYSTFPEI